ncbi:hypothetical protein [Nocardiopsis sp. CNR-923]|uniref:hypothetical protein n=1 Tax=Nocardiopsis sp. CNR-923 TaxID=1904965 RepID=UPI00117C5BA6|nr:hypothetical protein [Nocardiopsis sp. CNR-923]
MNEGTPGAGAMTTVLNIVTWKISASCTFPHDPVFLTSAVSVTVLGQPVPVSRAPQTTTLDFAGDYGTGTSGVRVLVSTQQIHEAKGSHGHAELDLSATAQPLDESGDPFGQTVPLFDLVLGDVTMDCSSFDPSPAPTPTPTSEPSPEPSPTEEPYQRYRLSHEDGQPEFEFDSDVDTALNGDTGSEENGVDESTVDPSGGGFADRLALTGGGTAALVVAGLVVAATGAAALFAARGRRA